MAKKKPAQKSRGLTLPNGILMGDFTSISKGVEEFLSQPLPVLQRLALREVVTAVYSRAKVVEESHLALLKKHGAKEISGGRWRLETDAPGFEQYSVEFQQLARARFDVQLKEKVKLPAKVLCRGAMVDIVMDGSAALVFEELVEIIE